MFVMKTMEKPLDCTITQSNEMHFLTASVEFLVVCREIYRNCSNETRKRVQHAYHTNHSLHEPLNEMTARVAIRPMSPIHLSPYNLPSPVQSLPIIICDCNCFPCINRIQHITHALYKLCVNACDQKPVWPKTFPSQPTSVRLADG